MTRPAYDEIADWCERQFLSSYRLDAGIPDRDPFGVHRALRDLSRRGPQSLSCFCGGFADRGDADAVVIRPGYLDGHWTKSSWTDQGVRDKVGATHLPLPELLHAFPAAGLTLERFAEVGARLLWCSLSKGASADLASPAVRSYDRRMAGEFHLDRERAEIFGSIAGQYDLHRPSYPESLIDELAALRPECVLDIGCGTGRVATALMKRGLPVLGVELDERMAEVARGRGVPVEIASFEDWDGEGWRFDLITCGAAWHWIDPGRGVAKAAKVLRTGGTMARFWSYHVLDQEVLDAFDAIYREHAPDAHSHGTPLDRSGFTDPFDTAAEFSPVEEKVYPWERTWSADDWVGLVATFSDHQRLGPERLAVLLKELHAAIESLGGGIEDRGGAFALLTQRES